MTEWFDALGWVYDRQGKPISMARWAELNNDMDYKRVAETTIGDWWVSTVWLGMNNNHSRSGQPPIIFESMVFYQGTIPETLHPELRDLDGFMGRYYTEDEAIAGHDDICITIRRLMGQIQMADDVMREAIERANQPEDHNA